MKLFKRHQTGTSTLDALKGSDIAVDGQAALDKITGGTLSGCHTGGGKGFKLSGLGGISLSSMQLSSFA